MAAVVYFKCSIVFFFVMAMVMETSASFSRSGTFKSTDGDLCSIFEKVCDRNCGAGRVCMRTEDVWIDTYEGRKFVRQAYCCSPSVGAIVGGVIGLIILISIIVIVCCMFISGCPWYESRHRGGVVVDLHPAPVMAPYGMAPSPPPPGFYAAHPPPPSPAYV